MGGFQRATGGGHAGFLKTRTNIKFYIPIQRQEKHVDLDRLRPHTQGFALSCIVCENMANAMCIIVYCSLWQLALGMASDKFMPTGLILCKALSSMASVK